MWPVLERTRRRILGSVVVDGARPVSAVPVDANLVPLTPKAGASDTVTTAPGDPRGDLDGTIHLSIGRPELDRLCSAIVVLLGPATVRPDTPARLETSLETAIARIGGTGQVAIRRRPAGVYTPESWQVHLSASDPTTEHAVREAVRTGRFLT